MRDGSASSEENIALLSVKALSISDLEESVRRRRSIVDQCDPLSHEVVLAGCTHYVSGALAEALTCLWTSIEQLLSKIWRVEVEGKASGQGVPKRGEFLKDTRIWTTSARIELLFQIKILGTQLYIPLNAARRARNDFVHTGKQPDLDTVTEALHALFYLISSQATNFGDIHLLDRVKDKLMIRCILRPCRAEIPDKESSYWRAVRPLPGEESFVGQFDQFDLKFLPVETFDAARAQKKVLASQPKRPARRAHKK